MGGSVDPADGPGVPSSPGPSVQSALPLPGLEPQPDDWSNRRPAPALVSAVRRTLAQLDADGALTEADAGRTALAIELAEVITDKRLTRKTSTVGHDARVLMDILDGLAPATAGDGDLQLRRAMESWSTAVAEREAAEAAAAAEARAAELAADAS
jgi:hypothetical protein